MNLNKTVAIIPAAGFGMRMGAAGPKQYLELAGRPILALTLETFNSCEVIDSIIPVVPSTYIEYCEKEIVEKYGFKKVVNIIEGGEKRQDSVRLGLEASRSEYKTVVVHDGVRPFVTKELIEKAVEAAKDARAVITGIPAKDTIKKVDENNLVLKTYERKVLWLVQTPQVFRYEDLYKAHRMAVTEDTEVTDDAFLIERIGIPVKVIPGSETNIKITTPHDMALAEFLTGRGK